MKTEPAIIVSFAAAVIGLFIAVGLISSTLEQPINLVVAEFVALLVASGLIIRNNVTPVG